MAIEKPTLKKILITVAVVVVVFLGIGICCLCSIQLPQSTLHKERYDNCYDYEREKSCSNFTPGLNLLKCSCILNFELKDAMNGKVRLYYELESYNQTNITYAESRDDSQFSGKPNLLPARSCGNFSYYENKPIFPCGEVADSLFSDTFTYLARKFGEEEAEIPVMYTELFTEDTPKFKNPPADLLQNFTMPIHWPRNASGHVIKPWEDKTDLKGVENPAFRGWMDTKLKRKPVWRVKPDGEYVDGLPAGNYSLTISMFYGANRYNGVRNIILEGVYLVSTPRSEAAGIVLVSLSICIVVLAVIYIFACTDLLKNQRFTTWITRKTNASALSPNDDKEVSSPSQNNAPLL